MMFNNSKGPVAVAALALSLLLLASATRTTLAASCPGGHIGLPEGCWTEPCGNDTCYKSGCPPCYGPPHGEEAGLCLDSPNYPCYSARGFFCDQYSC